MQRVLFEKGSFFIGCNYWASHAGTNMWHDWNEDAIILDFERLSAARVDTLRVFPLWPDFQPIKMHKRGAGYDRELRMGEEPLPFTEAGQAGVSELMADRFERFLDLAQEHNIRLIVGLLTGWMSGRLYVPAALEGKNVLTDPFAIKWEIKYVRYMVKRFKDHPAIAAWDLGNECNCMGEFTASEQLYLWMASISMAIRVEDAAHPVVSGMHGLRPQSKEEPSDQGELLDVLCTHPYPIFTLHCDTDPLNCMKSALHAIAESRMYADLGGKPCFAEEVGTLGPMIASEEVAANYIGSILFGLWAHDCRGLMWWCANEQSALTHTPYDWNSVERELGLFRLDGSPKPVLNTLTDFAEFYDTLENKKLPDRVVDAVCVLTRGQDQWAAAYGTFILAKQAGFEIRFSWCDSELPEANAYLLPSLSSDSALTGRSYAALLDRVRGGATLYLSLDNALLSPFTEVTGLRVLTRSRPVQPDTVRFMHEVFCIEPSYRLQLESVTAESLAENQEGSPVFTKNHFGKGNIYFLSYPIEKHIATKPAVTDGEASQPLYKFYRALNITAPERVVHVEEKTVGLTEHILSESKHLLIVQNYEPEDRCFTIELRKGWQAVSVESVRDTATITQGDDTSEVYLVANGSAIITVISQV